MRVWHAVMTSDASNAAVSQAVQFLRDCDVDGALIVTTPQEVSIIDVRKEINFCKKARSPVPLLAGPDFATWERHHSRRASICQLLV